MVLLLLKIKILLINPFQKTFSSVLQLEQFVIDEHQSIKVSQFELSPLELDSPALGCVLADDDFFDLADSGVPGFLEVRCRDVEKSHDFV